MPRNPAKQKTKPNPKPPKGLEPSEERGVPGITLSDSSMPSLGESADHEVNWDPATQLPPAPPVQVIERRIETVTVDIPLGEPPHRFDKVHIEVLLLGEHAHTFARLRQALRDQAARTANGRAVISGPDIQRWLMEQFAAC